MQRDVIYINYSMRYTGNAPYGRGTLQSKHTPSISSAVSTVTLQVLDHQHQVPNVQEGRNHLCSIMESIPILPDSFLVRLVRHRGRSLKRALPHPSTVLDLPALSLSHVPYHHTQWTILLRGPLPSSGVQSCNVTVSISCTSTTTTSSLEFETAG